MIQLMKIFEIDPTLNIIHIEGNLIRNVDPAVHNFFKRHIYQSINNRKSKDVRFRSERSQTFLDCIGCFNEDTFEESANDIATSLAVNIHSNVTSNFHLIITLIEFTEGDSVDLDINNGEQILAIIKMETNDGVQMEQNEFIIQPNMLPDLGNQLQKGSFIIKSYIENYEENNQGTKFHSKILDKQDRTISNYFMNLLDSTVVADDGESSKLAQQFISRNLKRYVETDEEKITIDRKLGVIFSRRERKSVDAIIMEFGEYLNENLLENSGFTMDGLSDDVFRQMRQKNPSVRDEFQTIPYMPEKRIIKNEDRSVVVSIEMGLIEDGLICIDTPETPDGDYVITIPKNIID